MKEGWGWVLGAFRLHYFKNWKSLCGNYIWNYPEEGLHDAPEKITAPCARGKETCKACFRRLKAQKEDIK